MIILYGINTMRAKRVPAAEVTFPHAYTDLDCFELRQKYFYLYYIPIFPVGKVWVYRLRGINGEFLASPSDIQNLQNQLGRVRTPLLAWAGILAIFLGIGLAGIFDALDRNRRASNLNQEFASSSQEIQQELSDLKTGDLIVLELPQSYEFNTAKVVKLEGEKVQLKIPKSETTLRPYEDEYANLVYKFDQDSSDYHLRWVTKDQIKACFAKNSDELYANAGEALFSPMDNRKYSLMDIYRPSGPLPSAPMDSYFEDGELFFRIENRGDAGELEAIKGSPSSCEWISNLAIGDTWGKGDTLEVIGSNLRSFESWKVQFTLREQGEGPWYVIFSGSGVNVKEWTQKKTADIH